MYRPHLGKKRVRTRAIRLKADRDRNIPVHPPTLSSEWLKNTIPYQLPIILNRSGCKTQLIN
jgi:hypothetical protein